MWRNLLPYSTMIFIFVLASKEQVKNFIDIERPVVDYINHKYIINMTVSSRRLSRKSQIHYFTLDIYTNVIVNNNYSIDFYFYEFTSNRYQPSFVEMHFKMCDLITKNVFFGGTIRDSGLNKCPIPPGHYILKNMMIPPMAIPRAFPFSKGRLIANVTYVPKKEFVSRVYADMELKELKEDIIKQNKTIISK